MLNDYVCCALLLRQPLFPFGEHLSKPAFRGSRHFVPPLPVDIVAPISGVCRQEVPISLPMVGYDVPQQVDFSSGLGQSEGGKASSNPLCRRKESCALRRKKCHGDSLNYPRDNFFFPCDNFTSPWCCFSTLNDNSIFLPKVGWWSGRTRPVGSPSPPTLLRGIQRRVHTFM